MKQKKEKEKENLDREKENYSPQKWQFWLKSAHQLRCAPIISSNSGILFEWHRMDVSTQMPDFQYFERLIKVFCPGLPHEQPCDSRGISSPKTSSLACFFVPEVGGIIGKRRRRAISILSVHRSAYQSLHALNVYRKAFQLVFGA